MISLFGLLFKFAILIVDSFESKHLEGLDFGIWKSALNLLHNENKQSSYEQCLESQTKYFSGNIEDSVCYDTIYNESKGLGLLIGLTNGNQKVWSSFIVIAILFLIIFCAMFWFELKRQGLLPNNSDTEEQNKN